MGLALSQKPRMDSLSEFRDWAHLPPEIVDLISEKVNYIVDYVRFRAVCSTWRSASRPKPRHLPPQLPWLMLPYDGYSWTTKDDTTRFFYDVWESKMREIHLPETEVGDRSWKRYYYQSKELADVTCYNGRLYFLYQGEMVIIEYNKSEHKGVLEPELIGAVVVLADLDFLDDDDEPNYIAAVELTVLLDPELAAVEKYFVEGKSGVSVVGFHPEGKFMLYQFQEQQMKLEKITIDSTAIFYGDNYPCLALSSDDWDSLDGGSLYMEHRRVPDALKLAAVKSGYHTKFARMVDGNVMYWYDINQESPYHQAAPAMWFQPSFF